MKKWVVGLVVIGMMVVPAFAHPGGTDSSGGHYNRSTGDYHYHHGHSAHDHVDGVCPYDYDDRTGERSGSSSGSSGGSLKAYTQSGLTSIYQTLQKGDRGNAVADLQKRLNRLGYSAGEADGIFGTRTEGAVRQFQQDNGINATGNASYVTLSKLFPELVPVATERSTSALTVRTEPTKTPIHTTPEPLSTKVKKEAQRELLYALGGTLAFALVLWLLLNRSIYFPKMEKLNTPANLRRQQKRQEREWARQALTRKKLIDARIEAVRSSEKSIDYSLGIVYINRNGRDECYHNRTDCCEGGYRDAILVSACSAKELGFRYCQKCTYDAQPSRDAWVMINSYTTSRYHRIGSGCITEQGVKHITLNEARARHLELCWKCHPPMDNPKVWF